MNNRSPSARFSSISLFSGTAFLSPSSSGRVRKHSSPPNFLLQDPCLETLHPSPHIHLFRHIHNPFCSLFDWLCHKSCGALHDIWKQFSSAENYCFKFDGFHGFFCNNGLFNGVILPDSHDGLTESYFHNVDNLFHRAPSAMSLIGPYDTLIQTAAQRLCLGASRPFQCIRC